MIKVNIQEAKTHLSRYLVQVENGDVVVVCRHNHPVAELRAIQTAPAHPTRVAGLLKGRVHWEPDAFAPMNVEELAEFHGAPVFPHVGPALNCFSILALSSGFRRIRPTFPRLRAPIFWTPQTRFTSARCQSGRSPASTHWEEYPCPRIPRP